MYCSSFTTFINYRIFDIIISYWCSENLDQITLLMDTIYKEILFLICLIYVNLIFIFVQ